MASQIERISSTDNVDKTANPKECFHDSLSSRILLILADKSYRTIAKELGFNQETVRRYLLNGTASAFFLAKVCETYDVDPQWLLQGTGSRDPKCIVRLENLTLTKLFNELRVRIENMNQRVDILEDEVRLKSVIISYLPEASMGLVHVKK